ncbi:MAG: hypothetical protein AAF715_14770 [Myxococcota bacterium]
MPPEPDFDADPEWARIRAATSTVAPSPAFADRVMDAVADIPAELSLIDVVGRWGRLAVAAAAVAAGTAGWLALDSERDVNEELIATFDAVESSI